ASDRDGSRNHPVGNGSGDRPGNPRLRKGRNMAVVESKPEQPTPAAKPAPRPADKPKADEAEAEQVYAPDAPGGDPDSLERVAKLLESLPGDHSNDHADDLRKRAAKDREAALDRDSR